MYDQKGGHDGPRRSQSDQPNPQNQLIMREIHTNFGGLAGGGKPTSMRKAHTRNVRVEEVYHLERPPKEERSDDYIILGEGC